MQHRMMAHSGTQSGTHLTHREQMSPRGSLLLLELHTGLGWQGNGNIELRIGLKCTEKLSSSVSEPLNPGEAA